ncbi:unnamed protein product [Fraxinus pennsylvanica]|uniref:Uncharacterized protein n=1 Tax=Fraxinus pennsylvanica TaxID=56036 RepID=A0AAD1ZY78_9LAMI|nr:unnamed protein product [Fraxinus pennsylvanica]
MSDANVVKFSNDGRLLLTTSDGHIHLSTYNVKPFSSNSTLEASEGMCVISGSGDSSVYAWSVQSGKEVASWMSSQAEPPVIKWAPGNVCNWTKKWGFDMLLPICYDPLVSCFSKCYAACLEIW